MERKDERKYTPCRGINPHSEEDVEENLPRKKGNLAIKSGTQGSVGKVHPTGESLLHKKARMSFYARARRLCYGYRPEKTSSYASLVWDFVRSEVNVGVTRRFWSSGMLPYSYAHGWTTGATKIDLIKTFRIMERACVYLYRASQKGERFMFVGTKKAASETVKEVSVKCGQYYVRDCWLPGTISNWSSVAGCVSRLMYLRRLVASSEFFGFVKKERVSIWREKDKLEASLSGVVRLKKQPRVVIIVDPVCDKYAFRESLRQGLTVVSIVNTNADPYYVDFPIPGNSVTVHPIRLLLSMLSLAITRTRARKGKLRVRGNALRKRGSIIFKRSVTSRVRGGNDSNRHKR